MASETEELDRNKCIVRSFVDALNREDYSALDRWMAEDFVRHCQATPEVHVRSLNEFKQFDSESRQIFPDQTISLERLVAEDVYVSFWAIYEGTQKGQMGPYPPSHKQVRVEFGGVFRIETGMIAELWVTWDNMAMLAQLGHLPDV